MQQNKLNSNFRTGLFFSFILTAFTGFFVLAFGKNESFLLINGNHNAFLDFFFRYYTYSGDGVMWVPLGLYCIFFRREWLVAVIAGIIISTALTHLLKRVIYPDELRPFTQLSGNFPVHIIEGVKINRSNSFPSGHTVTAFSMAIILTCIINRRAWSFILPLLAFLAAYSRVYLAQHYLTDVLAGMGVGIVTGVLSVFLNKKFVQRKQGYSPLN